MIKRFDYEIVESEPRSTVFEMRGRGKPRPIKSLSRTFRQLFSEHLDLLV